jgi:glutaminyl-tRNA synthetase
MASPNLHLRDPCSIASCTRASHTGNTGVFNPTYDFAHPLKIAFEGITHSLCTLRVRGSPPALRLGHRTRAGLPSPPRQNEFAPSYLSYTVMSKRRLLELVKSKGARLGRPRLPTICGLRRRGYTPEAIREFCEKIGVTKYESLTDVCPARTLCAG